MIYNTNYSYFLDDEYDVKQHLNLSESAWLIIDEDIKNFYPTKEKESFSGFLNRVFTNFYQNANATISFRVDEKITELENICNDEEFSKVDKKTINTFINKYILVYEEQLLKKSLSYKNGHGEKFRINKANVDILKDDIEAEHYESLGLYLKAIFEEYATKPRYIREQIFFQDFINKIQLAIARQKKLKITLIDKVRVRENTTYNKKFLVSPYKIVQDKTNSFNYLVGYSEEIIEKEILDENGIKRKVTTLTEKKPSCFRLSRLEKCDMQVSMGAHISKESRDTFDKLLMERDVMYLSSEPIEIKVKFTDKGLESFKRQIYMRPGIYTIDKNDKHIYNFLCTEIQAINYFFKFGWDALIIEPATLANKFKDRYEKALKTYCGISKETQIQEDKALKTK